MKSGFRHNPFARLRYFRRCIGYLRNWSLGLDLQIIVRTIRLVFFDRHAY